MTTEWLEVHAAGKKYLALPRDYARALGGVRWSDQQDGLELSRTILASSDNLALFLEGFAARRAPLPFGLVVHWLALLLVESADHEFKRLHGLFAATGANWRNAAPWPVC